MERFTQEAFEEQARQRGRVLVLDDVLSLHVGKTPSPTLFAYPRADRSDGGSYFETYTAAQLDSYVDAAVKHLVESGHEPVRFRLCIYKRRTRKKYNKNVTIMLTT